MMKTLKYVCILALFFILVSCNVIKENSKTVKNVIILIPDGTTSSLLTLTRWYNDNTPLAIDQHICGMIRTYCSDGKIPDSAPAGTAYATGTKTISPYIGLDSCGNPCVSVLELSKQKGLSTGIVVTCEFPHATPADFVCHFKNRDSNGYPNLAKQFINNSPDIVFAGGERYIHDNGYENLLEPNKIKLITDKKSFNAINSLSDRHLWALFHGTGRYPTSFMAYECDRDTCISPSLSEMTDKAINLLSKNKNGFFLMVEGSQIDWATHNNDVYAAITDFLEFDKPVKLALDFAKKDKNTVVIICPDHGTGGLTIGNERSSSTYQKVSIVDDIIKPLKQIKNTSARKLAEIILDNSENMTDDLLIEYLKEYNINNLNEELLKKFNEVIGMKGEDALQILIGRTFSNQNYIGWTTNGHTGEDVFLAIYAPKGVQKLTGVVENRDIGRYIKKILKLD